MHTPVTVEVTRGKLVESRHRGLAVVVDGDGNVVYSAGEIETPTFPRSSCKAMQALPLIETGAADAYGFGNKELALACSSHSGEDEHVALAASMLKRAGRDESVLECGAHWSFEQKTLIHQARTPFTTIAPANIPASSAPAAMPATIRAAMPVTNIRCRWKSAQ